MPARDRAAAIAGEWAIPFLLAAVVVALGSYQLDRRSFWYDEAFSAYLAARLPLADFVDASAREFGWATYYVLLRVWSTFGTSEAALRGLSVLAAAVSVPVVYALGRKAFERPVALVACALLAFNPFFIRYAQEARVYTLAFLITALLGLAFLRAVDGPSLRRKGVWTAVAIIAIYVHFFAAFVVAAQALWLLCTSRLNRHWALAGVVVGVAAVPLAASFLRFSGLSWIPPMSRDLFLETLSIVSGSSYHPWDRSGDPTLVAAYLGLALLGLAMLAGVGRWRARDLELVPIGIGWLVPLALTPVLFIWKPTLIGLGGFLGIALVIAILHLGVRAREFRSADLVALAVAGLVPLVLARALVGIKPGAIGLVIAVALTLPAALLLGRLRGDHGRRPHVSTTLAYGWLISLALVATLVVQEGQLVAVMACLGLGLLAAVLLLLDRTEPEQRLLGRTVALWWLLPLVLVAAASLWKPMFIGRYFMVILPAWVLLCAYGVSQLRWRILQASVATVLIGATFVSLIAMYEKPTEDFRATAAFLAPRLETQDELIYAPATGILSFPLLHYLKDSPPELRLPEASAAAAELLQQASLSGKRIWLVIGESISREDSASLTSLLDDAFAQSESLRFGTLRVDLWVGRVER